MALFAPRNPAAPTAGAPQAAAAGNGKTVLLPFANGSANNWIMIEPGVSLPIGAESQVVNIKATKLLKKIRFDCYGTVTWNQPAGAAAPTLLPGAPWNIMRRVENSFSGNDTPTSVPGYVLHLAKLYDHRPGASTFSFPLPPANTGTTAVQSTENVHFVIDLPVAWRDPQTGLWRGLQMLDSTKVVSTVQVFLNQAANITTLPNGTTATYSLTADIYGDYLDFPNPALYTKPELSTLHTFQTLEWNWTNSGEIEQEILSDKSEWLRLYFLVYNGGTLDTANTAGLSMARLITGGDKYRVRYSPNTWTEEMAEVINTTPDGGVWVYDGVKDYPISRIDMRRHNTFTWQMEFANAPAANSKIQLVIEKLVGASVAAG